MKLNLHASFQRMIDETLAGSISAEKQQSLREHLSNCVPCQEYLSVGNRVIAGLSGFSFEVNPALNAKVMAALRLQAQQVSPVQPRGMQLLRQRIVEYRFRAAFATALVLSIVGSAFVYEVATNLLHFDMEQVRTEVLIFWLLPSFCATLCLLATPGAKRGIA
jgi:hypothetical protein